MAPAPARVAVPIAASAAVAAIGAVAMRRIRRQLLTNPDPLGGRPPRFPPGESRVTRTDDGAEIHTVDAGQGPVVVLVHGLTSNHDDWGPVAEVLVERGHRVVAVDQRGHGGSTVGSQGFGVERMAADLAQVLVALDLRDALVVGHSMGGMTALALAVNDPEVAADRVSGLCPVASAADLRGRAARLQEFISALPPVRALARHPEWFPALMARMVLGDRPSMALVRATVASFHRCPEATRLGATRSLTGLDLIERVHRISLPTLVIGAENDRLTPFALSEQIAAAVRGAQLVQVPGAGHMVIWEAVDTLVDHIAEFVIEAPQQRSFTDAGGDDQRRR